MTKSDIARKIVFWLKKIKEHRAEDMECLTEYARGRAVAYIDVAFDLSLIKFERWEQLHSFAFEL